MTLVSWLEALSSIGAISSSVVVISVEPRWSIFALMLEVTSLPSSQIPERVVDSHHSFDHFLDRLGSVHGSHFFEDLLLEAFLELTNERLILPLDARLQLCELRCVLRHVSGLLESPDLSFGVPSCVDVPKGVL
jgi:hypothetical protein